MMPQLFFQFQAVHKTWILVKRSPAVPKTNKGLELCDNVHCHCTTHHGNLFSVVIEKRNEKDAHGGSTARL